MCFDWYSLLDNVKRGRESVISKYMIYEGERMRKGEKKRVLGKRGRNLFSYGLNVKRGVFE